MAVIFLAFAAALLLPAPPSGRHRGAPARARVSACAPLTTERYGKASLHVDMQGTRSIKLLNTLLGCISRPVAFGMARLV